MCPLCAEKTQFDGNLNECVFVFVHIRHSRQCYSAGKIIKHTGSWILQRRDATQRQFWCRISIFFSLSFSIDVKVCEVDSSVTSALDSDRKKPQWSQEIDLLTETRLYRVDVCLRNILKALKRRNDMCSCVLCVPGLIHTFSSPHREGIVPVLVRLPTPQLPPNWSTCSRTAQTSIKVAKKRTSWRSRASSRYSIIFYSQHCQGTLDLAASVQMDCMVLSRFSQ